MNREELHRAVARATGENCRMLMNRGFSLVDDSSAIEDDDLDALIQDWELIEAEETSSNHHAFAGLGSRFAIVRTNRAKVVRKDKSNRFAKIRRIMGTAN